MNKRIDSEIKYLIDRYYQIQKIRVAMGNEIRDMRERDMQVEKLDEFHEEFEDLENRIKRYLSRSLTDHLMWDWLDDVKGVGPIIGASLITLIDPEEAPHASSVWKYAGLAPGQERKKGQKLDYNPKLKTACWKLGESFVKGGDKWRKKYEESREFYEEKFPEEEEDEDGNIKYTDGHKYAMAKRRTVKQFLAEFWAEWRERLGLPVSEPYAHRGDHPKNPKHKASSDE